MSVEFTLQLPDNPSPAGTTRFVALGGNGFTAPKGVYLVRNFASSGDATAGSHKHNIIMDPDYCSMLGYASFLFGAGGDADFKMTLVSSAVPLMVVAGSTTAVNSALGPQNSFTWLPPAAITPGSAAQVPTLLFSVLNVDTAVFSCNANIFIYDIRCREDERYQDLVAARGGI